MSEKELQKIVDTCESLLLIFLLAMLAALFTGFMFFK